MNSELQEKVVSNNKMDIWTTEEKSELRRGCIHGVYHNSVGIAKSFAGNKKGAKTEYY